MAGKGEVRWRLTVEGQAAEKALDSLKDKIFELAAGFATIEAAVKGIELAGEALTALGEKQDEINRLSQTIGGTGEQAQAAKEDLLEFAEAEERVSTATSKSIIGMEAYFQQLGTTEAQTKKLVQATLDFAARTGQDATESAHSLGKAIETGSGKALAQYGIEVDKAENATQRLDSITGQITDKMGGAALAATTTYTGAKKQLAAAEEEAKENLGMAIATLTGGEKPFSTAIAFTRDLTQGFKFLAIGIQVSKMEILDAASAVAAFASTGASLLSKIPGFGGLASGLADKSFDLEANASAMRSKMGAFMDKIMKGDFGTVRPGGGPGGSGVHGADESKKAAADEADFWSKDAEAAKLYQETLSNVNVARAAQDGPVEKSIQQHYKERDAIYEKLDALKAKELQDFKSGAISKEQLNTSLATIGAAKSQAAETANLQNAETVMAEKVSFGNKQWKEYVRTVQDEAAAAENAEIIRQEKIAATINNVIGGLGQLGSLIGGTFGKGLQEVSSGLGATLSSYRDFQQAFFTGDVVGMVTAGISTVKNLVGAIGHIFGGKTEAERIGEDIGEGVTDGLEKAIENTEKKDKIGRNLAEYLNADEIFKETGKTSYIFDLFNAWKLGAVNAKEAQAELGKAFKDVQDAAAGGDVASEAAMIGMIRRAKELQLSIPEIDKAVKALTIDAEKQLQVIYSSQVPGAGGARQAAANDTLFNAAFSSTISAEGLATAWQVMGPDITALLKTNGGADKLTGAAANAAMLAPLMNDPKFDAFRKAAEGSEATAKYTKDILDKGELSQQTLKALETTSSTFYDQAYDTARQTLGVNDAQRAAMEAMLPSIVQMQHAQELGLKLSPEMQDMLNQAQAAGMLPAKTVAEQSKDYLKDIRDGINKMAGLSGGTPAPGPANPGGGPNNGQTPGGDHYTPYVPPPGGYGPPAGTAPHAARGMVHTQPRLVQVHGDDSNPEITAPVGAMLQSIGAGLAAAGGTGASADMRRVEQLLEQVLVAIAQPRPIMLDGIEVGRALNGLIRGNRLMVS